MKTLKKLLFVFVLVNFFAFKADDKKATDNSNAVRTQIEFNQNRISTFIQNSGTFNQNISISNSPGFQWTAGSNRFAIFTTGLTLAANINNVLTMAAASYTGEWSPGYVLNQSYVTNASFKLYKVKRGDNQNNNPDWANWGLMVPYGAPYNDVNNNNIYEPAIDTPGVKGADQSIFLCMTDADPLSHNQGEGFGGGTPPMFAEAHMTAWCYNNSQYQDMQFIKWEVINKNIAPWTKTYFSIVADPDLGDAADDYIGCDTNRNIGYCYNADTIDGNGTPPSYGNNPPVVGISFLSCAANFADMTSFSYYTNSVLGDLVCETDPSTPGEAYRNMMGRKKDNTPFINPQTNQQTKYCYPGNPVTRQGWTEYAGRIGNCNGAVTGTLTAPAPPGDRRFVMSYGSDNLSVAPNDTQKILIAQYIARGSNFSNSMTSLFQMTAKANELCQNGFIVGISPTSTIVPEKFGLYQNYPNPFNPVTKIKFDIANSNTGQEVKLMVYNTVGKEVATLVNEKLYPGSYEVTFNGNDLPSGVYFYTLNAGSIKQTKRMALIK
ncbi:MAG: T9SS type A sorting domain-containing protein [bacterium]|nr:T9SS type A sorting domain-containing protein [bacterium]